MARRKDPGVLRYVVNFLRFHSGMKQRQFGLACKVDQAEISRFEKGKLAPSEEQLRRMAKVANVEWSFVVYVQQFYTVLLAALGRQGTAAAGLDLNRLEPVLLAVRPYLLDTWTCAQVTPWEEMRREAAQIWETLKRYPIAFRRAEIG